MKVKESQFCRFFINEYFNYLSNEDISSILNYELKQESYSLSHCLFSSIFNAVQQYIPQEKKDLFAIELLNKCNDYTNLDIDDKIIGPPVIVSFDKLSLCSFFDSMFVKPMYHRTQKIDILFLSSNCLDACEVVNNKHELNKHIKNSRDIEFPVIVANNNLKNEASLVSDIVIKHLELSFGKEKACDIIRGILTSTSIEGLISSYKILSNNPLFTPWFIDYLMNYVSFQETQKENIKEKLRKEFSNNAFLKVAWDGYNPSAPRQWTEWAALVGLTEKQLQPLRGPIYPGIQLRKIEEELAKKIIEEKKKDKNTVSLERLLEIMREHNDFSNIEPGILPEILLKDNRVWK